jgi:hypothetical protein
MLTPDVPLLPHARSHQQLQTACPPLPAQLPSRGCALRSHSLPASPSVNLSWPSPSCFLPLPGLSDPGCRPAQPWCPTSYPMSWLPAGSFEGVRGWHCACRPCCPSSGVMGCEPSCWPCGVTASGSGAERGSATSTEIAAGTSTASTCTAAS